MKKLFCCILTLINMNISFGADLSNVNVLDISKDENGTEVKLQVDNAPNNAFFYVHIINDDPLAKEKLSYINNKLKKGEQFELNLNIPSFSLLPSGSYYRSPSVTISGSDK